MNLKRISGKNNWRIWKHNRLKPTKQARWPLIWWTEIGLPLNLDWTEKVLFLYSYMTLIFILSTCKIYVHTCRHFLKNYTVHVHVRVYIQERNSGVGQWQTFTNVMCHYYTKYVACNSLCCTSRNMIFPFTKNLAFNLYPKHVHYMTCTPLWSM